MKMALWADYLTCRKMISQQIFTCLIVGVVVGLACGNATIVVPLLVFIVTVSVGFSLVALDERNGWQGYRCCFPQSRRDVIAGRTAFMALVIFAFTLVGMVAAGLLVVLSPLVGDVFGSGVVTLHPEELLMSTCVSLAVLFVMMALYFPLLAKFGLTKAARYLPLVFVMVFLLVVCGGNGGGADFLNINVVPLVDQMLNQFGVVVVSLGILAAGLLVYAVGGHIAAGIYEKREF